MDGIVLVVTLACLAFLCLLAVALLLPGVALRRAGRYLGRMLEDPEGEEPVPRQLHGIGGELAAVRRRLREQDEELRDLERRRQGVVAFLAHDLKTPLTSVLGYLELLRDGHGLSQEERAKYTGIALNKARRLEELVEEFFDINTMELNLDRHDPIQISFLLEQLCDEFYPSFAEKDLECVQHIEPHLTVPGDGDKLARVFENVLRNAVKYSSSGSTVEVKARRTGDRAQVSVTNRGLSIPEGELSNIFERFYRLDAARSTGTGGAGLGLAIAKEITELHGGSIRAESDGDRTTFTVELPLTEA